MAGPVAKSTAGQVSAAIWEDEVTTKAGKRVTLPKASFEIELIGRYYARCDHIICVGICGPEYADPS